MKRNWVGKQIKEQNVGKVVYNQTTIPGTDVWEFVHPAMPLPVGTLTIRWCAKATIEILHVEVLGDYRRCGVATKLIERVVQHYTQAKMVITGRGNRMSTPWLKKLFFEEDEALGWKRVIPGRSKAKVKVRRKVDVPD
jgi:GNAT superfamily N-acetyltransferase